MTIVQRDKVRAAVERSMQLDTHQDFEAAVAAVAQAFALPVEAVRSALEPIGDEVSA